MKLLCRRLSAAVECLIVFLCCSCGGTLIAPAGTTVADENKKTGDVSWVLTRHAAPHHIEGFASATSVNRGGSIRLFVNTIYPTYTIDVYRMGWYGGAGARRMLPTITRTGTVQRLPVPDPVTGFAEANWVDPYTISIPGDADATNWCSGVYLAKLTAGGEQSYIPFVVKDELRHSNIYFQVADATYQAYNPWLGKSLYANLNPDKIAARKVSYNRPYAHEDGAGLFFSWEYAMIRFLEREGADMTYFSDVDAHEHPALLANHEAFMNAGHDEYCTWQMLDAVEGARNAGMNQAFVSANNCYWQIRLEPSTVDGALDRTIIGYKEVAEQQDPYALDSDPSNDKYVTTLFSNVGRSQESYVGLRYVGSNLANDLVVSDASSWVYSGTNLKTGDTIPGIIGGELERESPKSPKGAVLLAHSPVVLTNGNPDVSDMIIYTVPSGAIVFAAGNFTMSWALDGYRYTPPPRNVPVSAEAQQMMRNILLRMRRHY